MNYREFWINCSTLFEQNSHGYTDGNGIDVFINHPNWEDDFIHVIEKRALDEYKEQTKHTVAMWKDQAEKLAEALDKYTCVDESDDAIKALDNYRKFKSTTGYNTDK